MYSKKYIIYNILKNIKKYINIYSMSKAERIIGLLRNKTKRVNWSFNPQLYDMFRRESRKEGKKPIQKIEELIINYLEKKGKI